MVAVAMSGGVDSSVTAARLKRRGDTVIGVTMQIWPCGDDDDLRRNACCGAPALQRAKAVAAALEIPHYVFNYESAFEETVIHDFCAEYARGRTPNPCIRCNQYLKFRRLLHRVREMGAEQLATGHYARVTQSGGEYRLLKATDAAKDQSYFLYSLGQAELAQLVFPVGDSSKPEVRAEAADLGLPVVDIPESQDVCFAPGRDYRPFLAGRVALEPGDIVDAGGKHLGRHGGLALYTVGQRHGLGIAAGAPRYVLHLDADANRLVVGTAAELLETELVAADLSWVSGHAPGASSTVSAKIRHRGAEAVARLQIKDGLARVSFEEPQKAVTPGQAVVFYDGENVLGGGVIERADAGKR